MEHKQSLSFNVDTMPIETTLVLIKPDAFERRMVSKILGRFEEKGLVMVNMQFWELAPRQLIEKHYEQDRDKPYFQGNVDFMTSGPILSILYSGDNAIQMVRKLQGNRETIGTIRGDFVTDLRQNLVHASDSPESASKETLLWFPSTDPSTDTSETFP